MNIAIDARTLLPQQTGLGTYAEILLSELPQLAKDCNLLYLTNKDRAGDFNCENVRTIPAISWADRSWSNKVNREVYLNFVLPRILRQNKTEVFHSTAYILPLRKVACKTVVSIHDMGTFNCSYSFSRKYCQRMNYYITKSSAAADMIITGSKDSAVEIEKEFPFTKNRIRVVHDSIDKFFFTCIPEDGGLEALTSFKIGQPYILTVGTIDPRKNIPRLVEAYSALNKELRSNIMLIHAGAWGLGRNAAFNKVNDLGLRERVRFLGYVSRQELKSLYENALAFVFPSLYEGFGIPVIEAMACGAPVITSSQSSMPEIAGDAAILIDPYRKESILVGLEKVITDSSLRKGLVEKGKERAELFTPERMAKGTLAIYREL